VVRTVFTLTLTAKDAVRMGHPAVRMGHLALLFCGRRRWTGFPHRRVHGFNHWVWRRFFAGE
jgi:hypothetical protein